MTASRIAAQGHRRACPDNRGHRTPFYRLMVLLSSFVALVCRTWHVILELCPSAISCTVVLVCAQYHPCSTSCIHLVFHSSPWSDVHRLCTLSYSGLRICPQQSMNTFGIAVFLLLCFSLQHSPRIFSLAAICSLSLSSFRGLNLTS